ncbi:hypothetical protein EZV62_001272 [Acer yangbiense]|uniref:S-protein homolog n=1 Tax=Acer yangbiense TaxID=1000413 RepID=A0A5C7ITE3_9ROSI|nr:hypothetical protein EZV62_001272 [Acer yangbiense]
MSSTIIIILLVVLMAQTQPASSEISLNPKYTVRITDGFDNNDDPLVIHCWSHDDDLGVHTLWMNNDWHWEFGNKFMGRTHFVCNMKHGTKEKTVDVYDTYNNDLKCERCGYVNFANERLWKLTVSTRTEIEEEASKWRLRQQWKHPIQSLVKVKMNKIK